MYIGVDEYGCCVPEGKIRRKSSGRLKIEDWRDMNRGILRYSCSVGEFVSTYERVACTAKMSPSIELELQFVHIRAGYIYLGISLFLKLMLKGGLSFLRTSAHLRLFVARVSPGVLVTNLGTTPTAHKASLWSGILVMLSVYRVYCTMIRALQLKGRVTCAGMQDADAVGACTSVVLDDRDFSIHGTIFSHTPRW